MAATKRYIFLKDARDILKSKSEEAIEFVKKGISNKKEARCANTAIRNFRNEVLSEFDLYTNN